PLTSNQRSCRQCTLLTTTGQRTKMRFQIATANVKVLGTVSNAMEDLSLPGALACETDHPLAPPAVTYNKTATLPAGQTAVSVGDELTYTLTATVSETQLTRALVLTDTLGTRLDLDTVTPVAPFTCKGANPLEWTLPA